MDNSTNNNNNHLKSPQTQPFLNSSSPSQSSPFQDSPSDARDGRTAALQAVLLFVPTSKQIPITNYHV